MTFEQLFAPTRLRKTASTIRKEVRLIRARDVVDWVDWFVSLEDSLSVLSSDLISGSYAPSNPTRYEMAKSHGAFRVITCFNIRDAIVYRHICDEALERALPSKVPGAFFSRRHALTPIGKTLRLEEDEYHSFFEIWLTFNQYRAHTMLNQIYKVLVVTDITNYFDSIQHDLLIEYLSPLKLPRKAMGLLGRLLEAFKPSAGHSPNPRVGLPKEVARAWIATATALRPDLLREVQSRLVGHQSDDVARLSAFLTGLLSGSVKKIGRYKSQKSRWPLQGAYYDARSWLILHIASSTVDSGLRSQLRKDFQSFRNLARTVPEKRVAASVARRLNK